MPYTPVYTQALALYSCIYTDTWTNRQHCLGAVIQDWYCITRCDADVCTIIKISIPNAAGENYPGWHVVCKTNFLVKDVFWDTET